MDTLLQKNFEKLKERWDREEKEFNELVQNLVFKKDELGLYVSHEYEDAGYAFLLNVRVIDKDNNILLSKSFTSDKEGWDFIRLFE